MNEVFGGWPEMLSESYQWPLLTEVSLQIDDTVKWIEQGEGEGRQINPCVYSGVRSNNLNGTGNNKNSTVASTSSNCPSLQSREPNRGVRRNSV